MKKLLFIILFLSLILFGCADENSSSDDSESDIDTETVIGEVVDDATSDVVIVNDGTSDTETATNDDVVDDEIDTTSEEPTDDTTVVVDVSDPTGDTTADTGGLTIPETTTQAEVTKINLSGLSNLVISTGLPSSLMMSGVSPKKLYSIVDGQLQEVTLEGGGTLEIQKIHKVKNGTNYKTFFDFIDNSGDAKRYMADASGDTVIANFNPVKASNLANSEYLQEINGKIYYRDENKNIRALSVSGDMTGDDLITEGVEQFLINSQEEIILHDDQGVFFRGIDGSLSEVKGGRQEARTESGLIHTWGIDAGSRNILLENSTGFSFVQSDGANIGGKLFRVYTENEEIKYNYSQLEAYNQYISGVNGVYYKLDLRSAYFSSDICSYMKVSGEDFVFCGSNKYYLGKPGTDAKQIYYHGNWIRHCSEQYQAVISDNYIYEYSNCGEEDISRKLSWNDPFEEVEADAVKMVKDGYVIKPGTLKASKDDVLTFCATKDGNSYAVEITQADTTPIITEIETTCESIIPL